MYNLREFSKKKEGKLDTKHGHAISIKTDNNKRDNDKLPKMMFKNM